MPTCISSNFSLIGFLVNLYSDFVDKGISVGAVVGIVVAVLSAILLVAGVLWWKGCFRRRDTKELGIFVNMVKLIGSSPSNFIN